MACEDTVNSGALSCSFDSANNIVIVEISAGTAINTEYEIRISGLTNPYSMEPTDSISITTKTQSPQYSFSEVTDGLSVINTIASSFPSLDYEFSNQVLSDSTELTISIAGLIDE